MAYPARNLAPHRASLARRGHGLGAFCAKRNGGIARLLSGGAAAPAEDVSSAAQRPRDPGFRDERMARLEAVLFVAREPMSTRKLAQLAGLTDGTEARTCVGRLNQCYEAAQSAFRVEAVAGGFQLLTRPRYSPWLRRMHQSRVETRLSSPAAETLAIIAYRQPVMRAEIEAIRGVKCGEIVRQLMERDLVRIAGKSDELGRPFLYATTRRFLQVFGLRDLDELPRADKLRANPSERSSEQDSESLGSETQPSKEVPPHEEESEVKASVKVGLAEQMEWDEIEGRTLRAAKTPSDDEDELDEDEDLEDDEEEDDDEEDDADEEDEEDLEEGEEWEEVDDEDDDEEEEDDEEEDEDWDEEWDDEEEEEEDDEEDEDWDDDEDDDDDEDEDEEEEEDDE